jgi:hypothetical protein
MDAPMDPSSERHRDPAKAHGQAAFHHAEAAAFWEARGNTRCAELARRGAALEKELAQLEIEWAKVMEDERAEPSDA